MAVSVGLTQGKGRALIRLLSLLSLILFAAGGLLHIAPLEEPSSSELAIATSRSAGPPPLQFTRFIELRGSRPSLFEFGELQRASVQWREKKQPEPAVPVQPVESPAPVEPPRPAPDTAGLELVGTVPGSGRAFALISDANNQRVHTVSRGEIFRNATVEQILTDRVILVLNGQRAELVLTTLGDSIVPVRQPASPVSQPTASRATVASAPEKPKPSLGMRGYMLTGDILQEYRLTEPALLITGVRDERSEVKSDDILLTFDGEKFGSIEDIQSILTKKSAGDSVVLGIQRDQNRIQVNYVLK